MFLLCDRWIVRDVDEMTRLLTDGLTVYDRPMDGFVMLMKRLDNRSTLNLRAVWF